MTIPLISSKNLSFDGQVHGTEIPVPHLGIFDVLIECNGPEEDFEKKCRATFLGQEIMSSQIYRRPRDNKLIFSAKIKKLKGHAGI